MKMGENLTQELMNNAYEKWNNNQEWDLDEFFNSLNYEEKIAVAVGDLNYQVENGGWYQYYDNGYFDVEARWLNNELYKLKPKFTPEMNKFYGIFQKVFGIMYELGKNKFADVSKSTLEELKELDDEYYGINNSFIKFMNEYLKMLEINKNDYR